MDKQETTIATITFREGSYSGALEDGIPHGKGMYTCENYSYNGEWHKGNMSGYGVMVYADGSVYDGFFEDNRRQGTGLFIHPNGTTYEGEWKNGIRHGRGVLKLSNGVRKEGEWADDRYKRAILPEDRNSEVGIDLGPKFSLEPYLDGAYMGETKNGLPHGRGVFMSDAQLRR